MCQFPRILKNFTCRFSNLKKFLKLAKTIEETLVGIRDSSLELRAKVTFQMLRSLFVCRNKEARLDRKNLKTVAESSNSVEKPSVGYLT